MFFCNSTYMQVGKYVRPLLGPSPHHRLMGTRTILSDLIAACDSFQKHKMTTIYFLFVHRCPQLTSSSSPPSSLKNYTNVKDVERALEPHRFKKRRWSTLTYCMMQQLWFHVVYYIIIIIAFWYKRRGPERYLGNAYFMLCVLTPPPLLLLYRCPGGVAN